MTAYDRKRVAAEWVTDLGLPLTINVVLHDTIFTKSETSSAWRKMRAQRLELANVQYLGWALTNRRALLPDRSHLKKARTLAEEAKARLAGTMEIVFVIPDYYTGVPRACMDGWGRRYIVITPDGSSFPCHAAHTIPGVPLASAIEHSLTEIWEQSELFNLFRGERWMSEPCLSCPQRTVDYGGCRCQAFHFTGVAAATDPACRFSPNHALIEEARIHARDSHEMVVATPSAERCAMNRSLDLTLVVLLIATALLA